jgi:hypothetical protein
MLATVAIARSGAFMLAATSGLMFFAPVSPAAAEEQTLHCKLVTHRLDTPAALPEIGGHSVDAGQYMGVATCDDGRIAYKRFVVISDGAGQNGSFKGYSTYTFENDDALTLSYTGTWDASSERGDYTLVSGTGKFAGATGTGSFKALDEPWEEANLYDISLELTLATQ